ncbi:apolipoprotein D isoform X1 [Phlebotomus papatasi]|uniref:apolipoprotein D isoform X1 n=1 Tax=Phlebotomus papatasi TaxID=29031 RepID=UPI002483A075|nr:apolipoprotein D isoform X1 [Phlebotomus papatasi]
MRTAFIFLLPFFSCISGHQEKCSDVVPMDNFDIDQFLGNWYVIQQTKTESRCIQHQIVPLEKPGEYRISQISPHYLLDKFHLQHEHTYSGILITDPVSPARMKARYALSFGDEAYIVITTDYDNFAGIVTCGAVGNSRSATILSRTRSLTEQQLTAIREKIEGFSVNIQHLSTISQINCPVDGIWGINIKIGHDILYPDRLKDSAKGIVKDIGSAINGAFQNGAKFFDGLLNRKARRI